jgi:hypothetical protein
MQANAYAAKWRRWRESPFLDGMGDGVYTGRFFGIQKIYLYRINSLMGLPDVVAWQRHPSKCLVARTPA